MRNVRILAAFGLATALAAVLAGCMFATLRLMPPDSGTIQPISIGDRVEIRLPGNAATGYEWVRTSPESLDGSPLDIIREAEYDAVDSGLAGSPGHFTFEYRAARQGTVTLEMVYQRPWQETPDDEPIDSFSVVIWVK